jgi:hypothetical protein
VVVRKTGKTGKDEFGRKVNRFTSAVLSLRYLAIILGEMLLT